MTFIPQEANPLGISTDEAIQLFSILSLLFVLDIHTHHTDLRYITYI